MSMPSSSSTRKRPERCRESLRKSRGASCRPAGRKRHGKRLRRPSISATTGAGVGRTSNGKTRESTFSKRWAAPMMLRPHVGGALNVLYHHKLFAQALQAMLKEMGIQANLRTAVESIWLGDATAGNYDLAVGAIVST